ncbi:hypothetical protein ACRB68_48170 [Actinomadura sp. RB68]|uniref:N-acetyltransferase domain-containing protein n=1 Tax=Actinomadura macrotermitis TaxID=2585200 RepID=A0A7K0C0X3_9ACTN|nr:hypothetical protein [Actinomadura macrotermitis]
MTAVGVDVRHRRRGLATAVTAALARAGRPPGIWGVYLQVEDGNEAARVLYRRPGFSDHHGHHYRVALAFI